MNNFRKKIQNRKKFLMCMITFMLILNGALLILDNQYSVISFRLEEGISFQIGVVVGIIFLGLIAVIFYSRALKDEDHLKRLYIREHDERQSLIKEKMAKSTLLITIITLIIAISITIFFDSIIAITLCCVLYGMGIIILILSVYYNRKY